jgi:hypothetical protein
MGWQSLPTDSRFVGRVVTSFLAFLSFCWHFSLHSAYGDYCSCWSARNAFRDTYLNQEEAGPRFRDHNSNSKEQQRDL